MDKADNQLKYENYREQYQRLHSALKNDFNLEAIFIEYAIMEDRTESILRHAEKWESYLKKYEKNGPALNSKIIYIKKQIECDKKNLLNKYFSDDLLNRILTWKGDRNRLIHALLKQKIEHDEIPMLAEQGKQLADELRNRTRSYNRAMDRKKEKDAPNG